MTRAPLVLLLSLAPPAWAAGKSPLPVNEVATPRPDDPDRGRILGLQEALDGLVHGPVLGRLRVGLRVEDLWSGRVLYGWRSSVLMDPASNQKVLSTASALLRLGNAFRFRTEVTGAAPDAEGAIEGDVVIRGSGDPSLRARHIHELAKLLVRRGASRVSGAILGDSRRIGCEEGTGRSPLRVGATALEVRVRPGERAGRRPSVSLHPAWEAFAVVNQAETRSKGRSRLGVSVERVGNRFNVVVTGTISKTRGEVTLRRAAPSHALFAAILLRQALLEAGVSVAGGAGVFTPAEPPRVAALEGALMALGPAAADSEPVLAHREPPPEPDAAAEILAVHESAPLPILLRRVNKNSDNAWSERVLEAAGGEVHGGPATTAKGVRVMRETLAELGLPASAFEPHNGSGLGHQNRVTSAGMVGLLRRLYFDPRIGPEIVQSLSVGGVDGTTKNRFFGSSAAHRVRAKTGTLNGVSCLSGYVGDDADVLVFSILVEGHRKRAVPKVRAAQVAAVNAMMRFARRAAGPPPAEEATPGSDLETGGETEESVDLPSESPAEGTDSSDPEHTPASSPGIGVSSSASEKPL